MSTPYEDMFTEDDDDLSAEQKQHLGIQAQEIINNLTQPEPEPQPPVEEGATAPVTNETSETATATEPEEDPGYTEEMRKANMAKLEERVEQVGEFPALSQLGDLWNFTAAVGEGPHKFTRSATRNAIKFATGGSVDIGPYVQHPKKSEFLKGVTDISEVVVPDIVLTAALLKSGGGMAAAGVGPTWLRKLGTDTAFKHFAKLGLGMGSGALVDLNAQTNLEDDNLAGSLKDMFPKFYSWIPDSWATNESMTPDQKRLANALEGMRLNFLGELIIAGAKVTKHTKGLMKGRQWVPKNKTAENYFNNLPKDELDDIVFSDTSAVANEIARGAAKQERSLKELGEYISAKGDNLDEPALGLHDVFDVFETGVRTADSDGIIGATVDAARIQGNIKTANGRLGSMFTPAALKFGLEADSLSKRVLIQGVVEHIRTAGRYDQLLDGKIISWKQIDEAGTKLAETFLDPRMDSGMMKGVLDELKNTVDGIKNLNDVAYDGAFKSIKGLMELYGDMDVHKAQAYIATSLAGQASDMAEGMRLMDGTAAVGHAQAQILDRLEYLTVEKGLAAWVRGSGLNNINVWKRIKTLNDPVKLKEVSDLAQAEHARALGSIIPDAKNVMDELRSIAKERPEFLRPLMLAYEFSDGKIDTMHKLNQFVRESLGTINKAFIDGKPEIPSILMRSFWSNIYNSALSAFGTPLKAGLGNMGGIIADPVSLFSGALLSGDVKILKRGLHVYGGVGDTLQKATEHMGHIYRKASSDPTSVGYIVRDDIALKNEEAFETLNEFANAASKNGEDGPRALLNIYETQEDLARHPWLRFGANSMTALDGFTRAFKANGEAKARAFDMLTRKGKEINAKNLKEAADEVYQEMFDKSGMITDKAVDYASREIALNLDSPFIQGLNTLLQRVPGLKPWLMFPRTATNMVTMFHKYSPGSILAGDYNRIALRPLNSYGAEEIAEILTSKGIEVDADAMIKFRELRAKIRGRVAIGTSTVMTAGVVFANDRLRGNGHYDPQRQRVRRELNWKPRTYKGWDGKWYSYEGMGPLTDWLALTADVLDNFDLISVTKQEDWLSKMSFLLGANLTSKSVLGQLEPMNDVLAGNPAALARWAGSFGNLLLPVGSQRAELARLFAPQLKVTQQEFGDVIDSKNPLSRNALPDSYDWIDGKKIGMPDNVMVRLWNAYSPTFKMHGGTLSPERQFLIDIEFDSRPGFMTNGQGVEYTIQEQSELQSIIGERGLLKKMIGTIMADAKRNGFYQKMKRTRAEGYTSEDIPIKEFDQIYNRLETALSQAIDDAEPYMSNYNELRQRQYDLNVIKRKANYGILPEVLNIPK